MPVEKIRLQVGVGSPAPDDLIFNLHFVNGDREWGVTYTYKHLSQLDSLICLECDKIKHVAFPVVNQTHMKELLSLFQPQEFRQDTWKSIDRMRRMIEIWCYSVLLRAHVMPPDVYDAVVEFFCLPYGPVEETDAPVQIAEKKLEGSPKLKRSSITQSFGKLLKFSDEEKFIEDFDAMMQKEAKYEKSQPPLIKASVQRGRIGKRGKLEYQIQLVHSKSSKVSPHVVYRRYSDFKILSQKIEEIEGEDFLFAVFPRIPQKCSFGMSLNEQELALRTRRLDAWFRDLCCSFKLLSSASRAVVRNFLNLVAVSAYEEIGQDYLDTRDGVDQNEIILSLQNRLGQGLVEAPRAEVSMSQMSMRPAPVDDDGDGTKSAFSNIGMGDQQGGSSMRSSFAGGGGGGGSSRRSSIGGRPSGASSFGGGGTGPDAWESGSVDSDRFSAESGKSAMSRSSFTSFTSLGGGSSGRSNAVVGQLSTRRYAPKTLAEGLGSAAGAPVVIKKKFAIKNNTVVSGENPFFEAAGLVDGGKLESIEEDPEVTEEADDDKGDYDAAVIRPYHSRSTISESFAAGLGTKAAPGGQAQSEAMILKHRNFASSVFVFGRWA